MAPHSSSPTASPSHDASHPVVPGYQFEPPRAAAAAAASTASSSSSAAGESSSESSEEYASQMACIWSSSRGHSCGPTMLQHRPSHSQKKLASQEDSVAKAPHVASHPPEVGAASASAGSGPGAE